MTHAAAARAKIDPDKMRAAEKACAKYRERDQAAGAVRRGEGGVQEGGAGQRALHARARHRELPGPDVRRERRRADPHELDKGLDPESAEVQEGAEGVRGHDARRRRARRRPEGTRSDEAARSRRRGARGRRRRRRGRGAGGETPGHGGAAGRGARDGGGRATRPRRPREPRRARSATPTPARSRAAARGHADRRCASPGSGGHARALAVRRRRRAGRVPVLRRRCRRGATSRPG